jgi:NTE family protein
MLEEASIPIDCIAGTSMGAMIGAAYCAGLETRQLRENARTVGWRHISRPVFPRQGLLSFERMREWLLDQLGDIDVRDLPIPFAAVATDLITGERVVLREGPLAEIVQASCAVPGLVKPVPMNGRLLCDGGVSDNLPGGLARSLGADIVIGVDVFAPAYRTYLGPMGVALAALETLVRRAGSGESSADCMIVPEMVGQSYIRLSRHEAFVQAGERATKAALPEIEELVFGNQRDRPEFYPIEVSYPNQTIGASP